MRGQGTYEESDHQNFHRIALAYASDLSLANLVLNVYPEFAVGLMTSLDHSMWFHESVDAGQWFLFCSELDHSTDGRPLSFEWLVIINCPT